MTGKDENGVYVDEPITEEQRTILRELGFEIPDPWEPGPWGCGAFSVGPFGDGTSVVIRELPYLPAVNQILKANGFRWNPDRREWHGEDSTKRQVEVLQALNFCSRRYYKERPYPAFVAQLDESPVCPVRVGTY